MAVIQQPTKFGFSLKYEVSGTTTSKTKNVDYINLTVNPTTEQAAADDQKIYFMASEINRGIIGGGQNLSILRNVYRNAETELVNS